MKIIREIFSGVSGGLSSKRTMVFLSFVVMIFISWASIFMGKEIQQFIFEGFMWIVLGGLFSVASEQFGQKFGSKITPEEESCEEPYNRFEEETPRRRRHK
jgi:hypothetical protein